MESQLMGNSAIPDIDPDLLNYCNGSRNKQEKNKGIDYYGVTEFRS